MSGWAGLDAIRPVMHGSQLLHGSQLSRHTVGPCLGKASRLLCGCQAGAACNVAVHVSSHTTPASPPWRHAAISARPYLVLPCVAATSWSIIRGAWAGRS